MSAALITTCFREAGEINRFLDAVFSQTRQPDEIVIVDAGSDDGTLQQIQQRIADGAPLRLIVEPGASRSRGRNLAIAATTAELIAVTDVGALPSRDWFERIVAPLEAGWVPPSPTHLASRKPAAVSPLPLGERGEGCRQPSPPSPLPEGEGGRTAPLPWRDGGRGGRRLTPLPPREGGRGGRQPSALPADVVCGYYVPHWRSVWEAAVAAATVPAVHEVRPETFLPSARSVAFRRWVWEAVGGYPEWARHNEDTPFALALRAWGARFLLEPQALVQWRPQAHPGRLFVQFYRYARGDAQGRIWFRHYAKAYGTLLVSIALAAVGVWWQPGWALLVALMAGYWARHALRALRRLKAYGTFHAAVPTTLPDAETARGGEETRTDEQALPDGAAGSGPLSATLLAGLLAPLANLIVDLAHVVGYTRGLLEGRAHAARAH